MTDHDKDKLGGQEWQLYVKIKKVYISPAKVPPASIQYSLPCLPPYWLLSDSHTSSFWRWSWLPPFYCSLLRTCSPAWLAILPDHHGHIVKTSWPPSPPSLLPRKCPPGIGGVKVTRFNYHISQLSRQLCKIFDRNFTFHSTSDSISISPPSSPLPPPLPAPQSI